MKLAKSIEQKFHLEQRCIWNFGKSNSSGVAILLFNENIKIEKFNLDFYGRVIRLDFSLNGYSDFRIINAYFPVNSTERLEFISELPKYLIGARHLILGGD